MDFAVSHCEGQTVIDACDTACALAPISFPEDLPTDAFTKASKWHPFELPAWEIGEGVRQALKDRPELKRNPAVLTSIATVAATRNLRRGRQSFVLALGFKAASHLASSLARHLDDPDIRGHVVDTLLKMRSPDHVAAISPLQQDPSSWVRRLSRKYVDRYGAAV